MGKETQRCMPPSTTRFEHNDIGPYVLALVIMIKLSPALSIKTITPTTLNSTRQLAHHTIIIVPFTQQLPILHPNTNQPQFSPLSASNIALLRISSTLSTVLRWTLARHLRNRANRSTASRYRASILIISFLAGCPGLSDSECS